MIGTYSVHKVFFFFFFALIFLMPFLSWILQRCFHLEYILKYSTTEYSLILFSFLVNFKVEYCFFPFLNKIHLALSSPKCIDGLLSISDSQGPLKSTYRCFLIEQTFSILKRRQVSSGYSLICHNQLQLISYHLQTIKKYRTQNGPLRNSTV